MQRLIAAAALALVAAPLMVGTARAVSTCAWDSGSKTITIDVDGFAELAVSGSTIQLDGNPCDAGATTNTVDLIVVTGGSGSDLFWLDLRGGALAPGASVESGISEIEMTVDLGGRRDDFTLIGTEGRDSFSFGTGGANLNGDDDVDAAIADLGDDIYVSGNAGSDTISAAGDGVVGGSITAYFIGDGGDGNDVVIGGNGDDFLSGGKGQDLVAGGRGLDYVTGDTGADDLRGGAGVDTVSYHDATGGVTVSLQNWTASGGGQGIDQLRTFETVVGSRRADVLTGNAQANTLLGLAGNDQLYGGRGDDVLYGDDSGGTAVDHGADRLSGGPGQDRLFGRDGRDDLRGGAAHDVLKGGGGGDRLNGGGGPDLLHGNAGNDGLNGGAGIDACYQDAGSGPKTSCERPALSRPTVAAGLVRTGPRDVA